MCATLPSPGRPGSTASPAMSAASARSSPRLAALSSSIATPSREKNLRIGLQYTLFNKYLGAKHNFDGAGTNARDLNTLYLYLWTAI